MRLALKTVTIAPLTARASGVVTFPSRVAASTTAALAKKKAKTHKEA
jgi:hypothetical protein